MDTASLIDLILERCGIERMLLPLKTRMVKLLYLTEVEYYRRTGKRLTDLDWKFHLFGPYASVLENYLGDPNVDSIAWSITHPPEGADHDVQQSVAQVVHAWGDTDLNTLLDYVYFETEPMQSAHRGDSLDFSGIKPLAEQHRVKIVLDSRKLNDLRTKLTARAADYELLRTASEVSENVLENLKEWDIDRAVKLSKGGCKIDPQSLT
jgi:hypothetical protein